MSKRRKVVHAIIVSAGGRFLILKRAPSEIDPEGLWDLPGGSVEPGEHPVDAIIRECREELGCESAVTGWVGSFEHPHYRDPDVILECDHYRVMLLGDAVWRQVRLRQIRLNPKEHTASLWVTRGQLEGYTFLGAIEANKAALFGELKA